MDKQKGKVLPQRLSIRMISSNSASCGCQMRVRVLKFQFLNMLQWSYILSNSIILCSLQFASSTNVPLFNQIVSCSTKKLIFQCTKLHRNKLSSSYILSAMRISETRVGPCILYAVTIQIWLVRLIRTVHYSNREVWVSRRSPKVTTKAALPLENI